MESSQSLNKTNNNETTLNYYLNKAVETPSKAKRKATNQNSAERHKSGKVLKDSPPTPDGKNIATNMTLNEDGKPKMIRATGKELQGIECASAHYMTKAILEHDAILPAVNHKGPTLSEATNLLSDVLLDNRHLVKDFLDGALKNSMVKALLKKDEENKKFFSPESETMIELTNQTANKIISILNNETFKNLGGEHHDQAKNTLASKISSNIQPTLFEAKDELLPYLLKPSRSATLTKDLHELMVRNIHLSNKWESLLSTNLPTAGPSNSIFTLSNKVFKLEQTEQTQKITNAQTEHQVNKLAVRMGLLKTSELEHRYEKIENTVRIHGINYINEGTDQHFRSLSEANKHKEIDTLVKNHTSPTTQFSIQLIQPQASAARQFDALAIITFTDKNSKFLFEKNFAVFKRGNPKSKTSISRPIPEKTASDLDQPDYTTIRNRIGMLYNQNIARVRAEYPDQNNPDLTQQQIDAIQVTLKTKTRPFATFYEFLCPTNNVTFMAYIPGQNPFHAYDFTQPVPNPLTRKHIPKDSRYSKAYPARLVKKK